jgi:hypothetical protein
MAVDRASAGDDGRRHCARSGARSSLRSRRRPVARGSQRYAGAVLERAAAVFVSRSRWGTALASGDGGRECWRLRHGPCTAATCGIAGRGRAPPTHPLEDGRRAMLWFQGLSSMDMDELIRRAIRERRLIEFTLHGLPRVAEPHVYGVCKRTTQLLIYQVRGQSRSGGLPDWRRVDILEMQGARLLDEVFSTPRMAMERHKGWDRVFARVE